MPQLWFFTSIAFSFIAWGTVTARYIWPVLRLRDRAEAMRPLLILHSFRFMGLAFLVPGVVSPDLPPAFAHADLAGAHDLQHFTQRHGCRARDLRSSDVASQK